MLHFCEFGFLGPPRPLRAYQISMTGHYFVGAETSVDYTFNGQSQGGEREKVLEQEGLWKICSV